MTAAEMAPTFTLTPETRASTRRFLRRQFFHSPPLVTKADADLSGKTAIVTGGNSGVGLEAARHLLDLGSNVILAVRDVFKGQAAAEDLARGRILTSGTIEVWQLDLADYKSIVAFAERAKTLNQLDIVLLNAGVIKATETFNAMGYEESFQTNYLSTTLLLLLILPIVKDKRTPGSPGRIAVTSSDWAAWAKYDASQSGPTLPRFKVKSAKWDGMNEYGIGKLFNHLFVAELVKRVSSSEVIITHPDPGTNRSGLGREASGVARIGFFFIKTLLARDATVGSRGLVHSVTTKDEEAHGQFFEDEKMQP